MLPFLLATTTTTGRHQAKYQTLWIMWVYMDVIKRSEKGTKKNSIAEIGNANGAPIHVRQG
jgi:hypothetical protein